MRIFRGDVIKQNLLDEEKPPESEWIALFVYRDARIAAVESIKRLGDQKKRYLGEDERAWRPR